MNLSAHLSSYDLIFECPPLLFRLAQLYFERFVLRAKRRILRFEANKLLSQDCGERNVLQQINNAHAKPPCVGVTPNDQHEVAPALSALPLDAPVGHEEER